MCSHHTHFPATTVTTEPDAVSARPAHNTKLEDQTDGTTGGKVAVITGGSSGIGLATAQRFVDEGAHVFIMGRRGSELDKVKALIGDGLSTVTGDVTNSADLDKLFATVLDTKGGLDILVANSARVEAEMLGKITEENFDATFNLNARVTSTPAQRCSRFKRHCR
jgi:NAD(P)-dependent dehydrogenase (short-subunit alcohol dehydrogenase family)